MKRTIFQIYALAVCFVTMCASIVLMGLLVTGVVDEFIPFLSKNDYFERAIENNDSFWQYYSRTANLDNNFEPPKERPPEDQLTALRDQSRTRFYERQRRQVMWNIVGWSTYLGMALFFFSLHWRVARKLDIPRA